MTLQDQAINIPAHFAEQFAATPSAAGALAQFRQAGFDALHQAAFPTRADEDWKYSGSPVGRMLETHAFTVGTAPALDAQDVQAFFIPDLEVVRLVFVNGHLQPQWSDMDALPQGLTLLPMAEALEDAARRTEIEAETAYTGGTAQNAFLPLNRSMATQGVYLRAARNAAIDKPVHCVYISTPTGTPHSSYPQHVLHAETGSTLTLIESYHATDAAAPYFTNAASWVHVAANAHVHHYRLQTEGTAALQVNSIQVRQHRDSTYSAYTLDLGGHVVRNNLGTCHFGTNLETNYYGVYFGTGQQHIDNQTFIDHAQPHGQSNELYKGILTDYARGVFNGKVMVRQDAQKTNAYQQNSSLVLSNNAIMDAKPQLEIFADDVRCSHGATIGQLDEGSVFYLRSRGIPEAAARGILQEAFLKEAIEKMPHEPVRLWAFERLGEKFSRT